MSRVALIRDDWMDSLLMPGETAAQAELTITIRVYLARHPATQITYNNEDNTQTTVQTLDWDNTTSDWAQNLKTVVEDGWNSKLWLVPSSDWRFERPPVERSNYLVPCVACRLVIEYAGRSEAHLVVNCYHIARDGFARSSMTAPYIRSHRRCSLDNEEVFGTLDTNDIYPKDSGQIPALHEFGHYIGLGHVNRRAAVRARRGPNSTMAYGTGYQGQDLMGSGTRIEGWHGYPWCRRLRRHLGGQQPTDTDWQYVRGSTPTWRTGTGSDEVSWDVVTRERTHVTIDNMSLYGLRTDWTSSRAPHSN